MDVPSREEFQRQKSLLEALCRHLKIVPSSCEMHSEFRNIVKNAIRNGDEVKSWTCEECGAIYHDEYPVVFSKE